MSEATTKAASIGVKPVLPGAKGVILQLSRSTISTFREGLKLRFHVPPSPLEPGLPWLKMHNYSLAIMQTF